MFYNTNIKGCGIMKNGLSIISSEEIKNLIYTIRGKQVQVLKKK